MAFGENVGSIEYDARINTSQLRADAAMTEATVGSLTETGSNKFKNMASAIGSSATKASVGILAIGAAVSLFAKEAVSRVDTLNNFPKVMSNMGISAEDATKASKQLVAGIQGLPTTLDTATLAVQRLTTKTQNVGESTKIFLALNNAVLAGGAPMQLQAEATEQFAQAFSKGKPDMMEWRSMLAAMPAQLNQVAKAMGLADVDQLGEKLRDGSITMQQFSDKLVQLNSQGVGGLPSFAQQAKNATAGIGTGFQNAKTAVVRGLADIIGAIGASKIADTVSNIGSAIEKVFKFISENVDAVAVFIGTILATAFGVLAYNVIAATWPILAVAAAVTGLYLLFRRFKPQIDAVIGAFQWLWNLLKPIREFVATQFTAAWDSLRSAWENLRKTLEPFLPQLKILAIILGVLLLVPLLLVIGAIGLFVIGAIGIITVVARVIGWLAQLGSWFVQLEVAIFRTAGQAIEFVRGIPGKILGAIGDFGRLLYNKGRDLIQGLIDGAGSLLKSIGKFFLDKVPGWIQTPFKKALGISSPSKVFAGYGKNLVQGLTQGVSKNLSLIDGAMKGLSASASLSLGSPNISGSDSLGMAGISNIEGSGIGGSSNTVTVNVSMQGIMARSKADERDIAKSLVRRINEELTAKNVEPIGGGALT